MRGAAGPVIDAASSRSRRSAWAVAAAEANRRALLAVCGDERLLPPARGGGSGPLGCGVYGCVMPTSDDRVVFKITSDPDEAGFVAAALGEPDQPAGVVTYYAVAELEQRRRGRPVYAIWREAAREVGALLLPYGPTSRAFYALRRFRYAAVSLRAAARRSRSRAFVADSVSEARSRHRYLSYSEIETERGLTSAISSRRGVARGAMAYAAAEMHAQALSRIEGVYDVGESLVEWIGRGVLVCDVHPGNLGLVVRGLVRRTVITDPGQALLLDGSHAGLSVPKIASAPAAHGRFP